MSNVTKSTQSYWRV